MKYYSNKKLWMQDGKRLALFAREMDESNVEIFTLYSSKNDPFHRYIANEVYKIYLDKGEKALNKDFSLKYMGVLFHPQIEIVSKKSSDKLHYFADLYCKENFYRFGKIERTVVFDVLYKKDEIIYL